jgi:hypothetical protein
VFGVLGDIHGAFDAARAAVAQHPGVPFWLCVGDLASDDGRYESIGAPIYWIHGNNDNFDAIAAGDLPSGFHHIRNGTAIEIAASDGCGTPLRIAGLGGTFAPTWYETAAADLPHGKKGRARASSSRAKSADDKRRHFVRAEVEACKQLRQVDVFLTHEAAKPFRPFPGGRGPDAGKAQINEALAAMRPRLHLFGHHHRPSEQIAEGVRSVGLDLVSRGYLLIDPATLRVDTVKY